MLHVACCLWDANQHSQPFSRCYDESWVEKLYRGVARNLSLPFRFVCFTDRERKFEGAIEQERLKTVEPHYGCLIEPFGLDEPSMIFGLDTVIVGNLDHIASYCLHREVLALPRDPYKPEQSINAVALAPRGHCHIADDWRGENDMEWLRTFKCAYIDDLFPGQVLSLKAHDVRRKGVRNARIVYMHGEPKAPSLMHHEWVRENWR